VDILCLYSFEVFKVPVLRENDVDFKTITDLIKEGDQQGFEDSPTVGWGGGEGPAYFNVTLGGTRE
jgi:hypothetical protein